MIDSQTLQFVVATVIGLLALVQPVISLVRRQKKELTYDVVYDKPAIDVDSLALKYPQFPSNFNADAHIVALELRNTGNITVHESDYMSPIKFEFDAEIIAVNIVDSNPPAIINMHQYLVQRDKTKKSVLVGPLLLNSQNWIKFEVLLSRFSGRVNDPYAHIVGISKIISLDKLREARSERQAKIQMWFEYVLVALCIAIFFILLFSLFRNHSVSIINIYVLSFLTLAFLIEFVIRNINLRHR